MSGPVCVRGRGHLLGEVEEEGSFKDIMIWKMYLTKQQQGFQCFSFWQSDLLKSKAKAREERKKKIAIAYYSNFSALYF